MLLSIIVPVYKVEEYISTCLQSIYNQGLSEGDFEVILVNDGTPDNSIGVIEDIVFAHQNIKIVEQENQGLSVARNTGLKHAVGDYVLFVDSDDLLVDNALNILLSLLDDKSVDLIVAGFVKMTNAQITSGIICDNKDYSLTNKSGIEIFLNDLNPRQCYVWRTIYKKTFLENNHISFIPGIYFEDVPFTTECYLKASKCILTSFVFYVYRQRDDSIVSSINMKKLIDMNKVVARLWLMRKELRLSSDLDAKLVNIIFVTFSIAVWYITHDRQLFLNRKVFVSDLKHRIPDMQFHNGFKQKIVSWSFRLIPNTYIKILYLIGRYC